MIRPLLAAVLLATLAVPDPAAARRDRSQEAESGAEEERTPEEIVERILVLRRELEALLAALPPELREEIERRWSEGRDLPAVTGGARDAPTGEGATPPRDPEPGEVAGAADAATCGTLAILDSDGDGRVAGLDRHWRHLRLIEEGGDVLTLYDAGIREIGVRLRSFVARKDAVGDVRVDDAVRLRGASGISGVLAVDADALARTGELRLTGPAGETLSGVRPLSRGVALTAADGTVARPVCSAE